MSDDRKPTPEQLAAANPKHSVWVAASAGSGKTHVLVDRVIRLMLDGAVPDTILCLTFTKAAAAEMKERLFQRLSSWSAISDAELDKQLSNLNIRHPSPKQRASARRLFAQALETPGGLKIQTIHAFCEKLLQLFPVESSLATGFRVMSEVESAALVREAMLDSLRDGKAWGFLAEEQVASLARLEAISKPFLAASTGLRQRLSDMNALAETEALLREVLETPETYALDDLVTEICNISRKHYERAVDVLMPIEHDAGHSVPKFLQAALAAQAKADRLQVLRDFVLTQKGTVRKNILRKPARNAHPALASWLDEELERLIALFEEHSKQTLLHSNLALYQALATVVARINILKRSRGHYDFDDLISRTAALLGSSEAAQWVLYKLDRGLEHILVDEAQDTSPAQWTVIKALAGVFFTDTEERPKPRTLFVVGDIKQSIYSFQGADVASFAGSRQHFAKQLQDVEKSLEVAKLAISYRGSDDILNAVNTVFKQGSVARMLLKKSDEAVDEHAPFDRVRRGRVELWDLELADDQPDHPHWTAPIDTPPRNHPRIKLANRIATTIKQWIEQGRTLSGHGTPVQAGDILILLQRRNALFHALISALRRNRVEVAGADRLQLQASLIVKDLMMLGQFLRFPQDDHALACVLKSPLVPEPIDDDALFNLAYDQSAASLWSRLPAGSENQMMLSQLMTATATPFELFAGVLRKSRQAMLTRLGQEAEDAATEFLNLALEYEQTDSPSLIGFLDWMAAGDTTIRREMEQGGGAVRIMTVHGAKGLQAPIVFLADSYDPPQADRDKLLRVTSEGPTRGLMIYESDTIMALPIVAALKQAEADERDAERMRLLYVGMTRAADELYICGSLNKSVISANADKLWYEHVQRAFQSDGLQNIRRVDGALRYGSEPEFIGRQSTTIKETTAADWAVPLPKSAPLQSLSIGKRSDNFDHAAIARGLATHRLVEMMADIDEDARLQHGLRWAKRLNLEDDLVQRLHDSLTSADLAPLFGADGQSEVTIEAKGQRSGRIDRLAITPQAIYLLDYKTNRFPPETIAASHDYAKQMAGYAQLLSKAYPGLPIRAALLWTQTGKIHWISPDILSQSLEQETA